MLLEVILALSDRDNQLGLVVGDNLKTLKYILYRLGGSGALSLRCPGYFGEESTDPSQDPVDPLRTAARSKTRSICDSSAQRGGRTADALHGSAVIEKDFNELIILFAKKFAPDNQILKNQTKQILSRK